MYLITHAVSQAKNCGIKTRKQSEALQELVVYYLTFAENYLRVDALCASSTGISQMQTNVKFSKYAMAFFSRCDILLTRVISLQRIQLGIVLTVPGEPEFVASILAFAHDNTIQLTFLKKNCEL